MRFLSQSLVALNAIAYLLASFLSTALHTHEPHRDAGDGATANICTSCACGHHHKQRSEAPDQDDSSHSPDQEHDCVVCEFVAKAPLPVEPVRVVDLRTPVVLVPERELISVPVVFLSHFWGRAPPVA